MEQSSWEASSGLHGEDVFPVSPLENDVYYHFHKSLPL